MARRILTLSVEDDNNEFVFLAKHADFSVEVLEILKDDEHRFDLLINDLSVNTKLLFGALERLSDEEIELVKNDILATTLLAVRDEMPALSVDAAQRIVRTVNNYAADNYGLVVDPDDRTAF